MPEPQQIGWVFCRDRNLGFAIETTDAEIVHPPSVLTGVECVNHGLHRGGFVTGPLFPVVQHDPTGRNVVSSRAPHKGIARRRSAEGPKGRTSGDEVWESKKFILIRTNENASTLMVYGRSATAFDRKGILWWRPCGETVRSRHQRW